MKLAYKSNRKRRAPLSSKAFAKLVGGSDPKSFWFGSVFPKEFYSVRIPSKLFLNKFSINLLSMWDKRK